LFLKTFAQLRSGLSASGLMDTLLSPGKEEALHDDGSKAI
jgi:hypothetical protein